MATTATSFEEVRSVILAMDREFSANLEAGDIVKLVDSFYAEDARVLPPNQPAVEGRAAIIELWKAFLGGGVKTLKLDTDYIELSGNIAYGQGRYSLHMEPPGGPPLDQQGKYLVVYRRDRSGAWKAAADMFSSNS